MKTTHILKTSVGVTCEMTFDESNGSFICEWSPPPPFSPADRDQAIAEYLPWRDAIFSEWSQCTGKRVKLLTI
jgi:hypothetical protein